MLFQTPAPLPTGKHPLWDACHAWIPAGTTLGSAGLPQARGPDQVVDSVDGKRVWEAGEFLEGTGGGHHKF